MKKLFSIVRTACALLAVASVHAVVAPQAWAQDAVRVGVIAPLTGPGAAWGMAAAEGTRLAADDINAKGGLVVAGKPYKIEVIAYNDQYKASEAITAYNRLTKQDRVKYIVVLTSAGTLALKPAFERDHVVGFTAGYSRKLIDKDNVYLYRIYSTPTEFGPPMIAWLRKRLQDKQQPRVAILNPNDETGWDLGEMERKAFADAGFSVVNAEAYERSVNDFQPLLTRVLANKPDVIELGASLPATAGLIVRQARELGYEGLFFKIGGAGMQGILDAAGAQASNGVYSITQFDPSSDAYRRIADAYKRSTGHVPNEVLVSYYDAATVLYEAIKQSGEVGNTAKFVEAMPKVLPMDSLQGDKLSLSGKETYGAEKQIKSTLLIGEIKDGSVQVIERINY